MKNISDRKHLFTRIGNSRSRHRVLFVAGLLAIGVALGSSPAVAKKNSRPFEANFTAVPTGPDTVAGNGIARHLGKIDIEFFREFESEPSFSNPCVSFNFMVVIMTAANGDELWMDYTGGELCVDFTTLPVITFSGAVDLVGIGGTGRFSDSTGDYQLQWTGEISASGVFNIGAIEGVIGY